MKNALILGLVAALCIGAAYHYRPQQTVKAGQKAQKAGTTLYHVTRTAVEAGMDEYQKPDLGK